MIRTFQGITPTVPPSCFIEETAVVIGDVVMGEECSAWFHAVIRGDVNYIRIGHNVVLHGCTIHNRVLVGMGAIIMDGAVIGEDSVVGAGALITEDTVVPPKSLILGSPAKVKRPVTDQELAWIRESAQNYIRYSRQYLSGPDKPRPGFWV